MTGKLILLRHGESEWNRANRFTGWTDVDLTDEGEAQARRGARRLAEAGIFPTRADTSVLLRSLRTLWLALEVLDRAWIPVRNTWRLNERHYGALQGLDKAETMEREGEAQVQAWRRGYAVRPPSLEPEDGRNPAGDARYAAVPPDELPLTDTGVGEPARIRAAASDTNAAVERAGVLDDFTDVWLAGGAFLEWLEGRTLPRLAGLGASRD